MRHRRIARHLNIGSIALFLALAAGLLLACGGDGGSSPTPTDPGSLAQAGGEATQAICHLAQRKIDIPLSKLTFHIKHGDWVIGPEHCDGQDNDCDGEIDEGGVCEDGGEDGGHDGGSDGGGDGGVTTTPPDGGSDG